MCDDRICATEYRRAYNVAIILMWNIFDGINETLRNVYERFRKALIHRSYASGALFGCVLKAINERAFDFGK